MWLKKFNPLQLSFLLISAAFAAVLLLRITLVFSYVPETGGVSVNVLFALMRLLNGFPLYSNPELPPYPVVQYMPLHYYVVLLFAKISGIQQNVHAVSVLNRLLCLAYDLLVIIPIRNILIKIFGISSKRLIASAFMCIFLVLPNPDYSRVDNLYLLLFFIAVYFFLKFISESNSNSRNLIYGAVTAALAIFTKQSGLFLLGAIEIYLIFFYRKWKSFLQLNAVVLFTVLLLFYLFAGNQSFAFYQNTVLGLKNGISLNWFDEVIIKTFFFRMYFFVAVGLALAILSLKTFKNERLRFIGIISIVVFACSVSASLKWGSSTNYFTEFLSLTFISSAVYLNTNPPVSPLPKYAAIPVSLFFILVVFNDKGWGHLANLNKSKRNYAQSMEVHHYLSEKLQKDDLLFINFHKENLLNVMFYAHAVFPQREIITHCTYPKKIFQYDDFSDQFQKGKVKFYVTRRNKIPEPFLQWNFNGFVRDTAIGEFEIFRNEQVR